MQQDRRKFYRIEHEIVLDYMPVSTQPGDKKLPEPCPFDISAHMMQVLGLEHLSKQLEVSLTQETATPGTRQLSQMLSQQLHSLRKSLLPEQIDPALMPQPQLVNLSEGGMALMTSTSLAQHSRLLITLIFAHEKLGLQLYGRVQYSREEKDGYLTGIEFETMPERCRSRLAACILGFQAQQRRAQTHD